MGPRRPLFTRRSANLRKLGEELSWAGKAKLQASVARVLAWFWWSDSESCDDQLLTVCEGGNNLKSKREETAEEHRKIEYGEIGAVGAGDVERELRRHKSRRTSLARPTRSLPFNMRACRSRPVRYPNVVLVLQYA